MNRSFAAGLTLSLFASAALGCVGAPDLEGEELGDAEQAVVECVEIRDGVLGDIEDAYVWSLYPGYNTGTAVDQSVGLSHDGVQYGLLKADLGVIPAGATMTSATLTLLMSASAPHTVRAHRVTAPWSEPTVTWQSFGGAYDPAAIASVDVNGYAVERTLDITALAQAWVSGTHANHGVLLEQDPNGTTTYKSSERATISQRPKLTLCYETDGAGSGGTTTSTASGTTTSSSSSAETTSSTSSGAGGEGGQGGAGGGAGGAVGAGGEPDPEDFVPTEIPGCRWWLRADSVETNGELVVSLDDKSGNGHVVSQADTARQASFIASSDAFNGRPAIHFNKTHFYEKVGGINMPFGSAPVSAFMVGSIDKLPDIGPNGFFAYYGGGATHVYARVQGIDRFRVHAENPYTTTLGAGTQGTAHVFGFTFTQGDLRTFRDGIAGETFQANMYGSSSNPSLRVGTTDAGTPYSLYGGEIAEIVLFDTALGDEDRQRVEQYLKARYGIQ
jgi:hypothetical protein